MPDKYGMMIGLIRALPFPGPLPEGGWHRRPGPLSVGYRGCGHGYREHTGAMPGRAWRRVAFPGFRSIWAEGLAGARTMATGRR